MFNTAKKYITLIWFIYLIYFNNFVDATAQKMKFFIKDFSRKYDKICWELRIWSHLPEKPLMENLIFCAGRIKWSKIFDLKLDYYFFN